MTTSSLFEIGSGVQIVDDHENLKPWGSGRRYFPTRRFKIHYNEKVYLNKTL